MCTYDNLFYLGNIFTHLTIYVLSDLQSKIYNIYFTKNGFKKSLHDLKKKKWQQHRRLIKKPTKPIARRLLKWFR